MKLLRRRRGMSQRELAKAMKVSSKLVSQYEHGTHVPTVDYVARFCKHFSVPADYLLDDNAKIPCADTERLYNYICKIIESYKKSAIFEIKHTDCSQSDALDALVEECNCMKYTAKKMLKELVS